MIGRKGFTSFLAVSLKREFEELDTHIIQWQVRGSVTIVNDDGPQKSEHLDDKYISNKDIQVGLIVIRFNI